MSEFNMSYKIKIRRQQLGLTLEEVADVVGVGKSTVRKWENGIIANMRRDKISKLAVALDTTPAYLMGWEDEQIADDTIAAMVAERIREQREANDLTLEQLAEKVYISADRLARFEDASQLPTIPEFFRLDDYFNCGLDYLAGRIWKLYGTPVPPELEDARKEVVNFALTGDLEFVRKVRDVIQYTIDKKD